MEDENEDSDADDESYTACLVAVLQMWMRAVIISHSCEVKGKGRYAIFTV